MRGSRYFLVLGACTVQACAHHPAPAITPAKSNAARASDSLDALISAKCPHVNDSTAAWRKMASRWTDDTAHPMWSNDSLRRVLLVMEDTDQAVRFAAMAHEKDTTFNRAMATIDKANQRRFEAILARYGWPTRSLVGAKGSSAAWLIAQHSDADSSGLQRRALAMMSAAPPGEVNPSELAYLTDRVRTNAHQPQLYGTQFESLPDSGLALRPIEDEAHVEERRAQAGIEPLDDYICTMRVMEPGRVLRHAPKAGAA